MVGILSEAQMSASFLHVAWPALSWDAGEKHSLKWKKGTWTLILATGIRSSYTWVLGEALGTQQSMLLRISGDSPLG